MKIRRFVYKVGIGPSPPVRGFDPEAPVRQS